MELCAQEVFRVAANVLHQEEAARDVVQDVFLAFQKYCRTIDKDCVRAWLRRVAFRKALREQERQSNSTALLRQFEETYVAPNPGKTPLESLLHEEVGQTVAAALRRLGNQQRACMELYLKDVDSAQAAAMLNISVSAYRSNLSRALMNLKKMLKDSL